MVSSLNVILYNRWVIVLKKKKKNWNIDELCKFLDIIQGETYG